MPSDPDVHRPVLSVGHGTLSADELGALLGDAGVEVLVDVRRHPGSRNHPQFGKDVMRRWLAAADIEYRWLEALGGRRAVAPGSPNTALRNSQFRGYADHMATESFLDGVEELLGLADARPVAVMCAESVWWRCHRRLLADHLVLVAGRPVAHLMHDGSMRTHPVTPGARRADDHVVYDAG